MIKIQGYIPDEVVVAVSGGPDSMAVLDFLRRSKRWIVAAHFHHDTQESEIGYQIVKRYCEDNDIHLHTGSLIERKLHGQNLEEYWRDERYQWLHNLLPSPIITCHHLDDCVEEWIISSLKKGYPGVIPYMRECPGGGDVFRPFLLTEKVAFVSWCENHDIKFISTRGEDLRTKLREEVLPLIRKHVNPGITKMVRKYIESSNEQVKEIGRLKWKYTRP